MSAGWLAHRPRLSTREQRIAATVWFTLVTLVLSAAYAALYGRGLYQDGAYYLLRVAERDWFYLVDPARTTVQVLRQLPVVLLSRFTDASLFQRAQAFTFVMLALPPALVGLCWFAAPRDRKGWVLLPVLHLLCGLSTTSVEAVGEGAISAAYFWLLAFLLLFRAQSRSFQLLFLVLAVPSLQLHEAMALCAPLLILICALRLAESKKWEERVFLGLASGLLLAGAVYQMSWIIHPRIAGSTAGAWQAIAGFEFLVFEGSWNIPVVSAALALAALATLLWPLEGERSNWSTKYAARIAFGFAVVCLLLVLISAITDRSFGARAQAQARYNPIFATIVLLGFLLSAKNSRELYRRLTSGPALLIILSLSATQCLIDAITTRKWESYLTNFEVRLHGSVGFISWEEASHSSSSTDDQDWQSITIDWTVPIVCIILARDGQVRALIDYPPWTAFRPLDPLNLNQLPAIRGVSYEPYRQAVRR